MENNKLTPDLMPYQNLKKIVEALESIAYHLDGMKKRKDDEIEMTEALIHNIAQIHKDLQEIKEEIKSGNNKQ